MTNQSRRSVLKKGAIATTVGGSLAGCAGGGGGGGGGDGGGDGGGETDTPTEAPQTTTGAMTDTQELETVRITLGPGGFAGMVRDRITNQTDALESRMNEAGYTAEVKETWQGAALFAAGGPDFTNFGSVEAAKLGPERDLNLAVTSKVAANWVGVFVRPGSPYDPEEAGSKEAAVRALAEDNAKFGLGSWGGGDVPGHQVIAKQFGLDFSQEGDFNVRTADYFALGKLVAQGELDAASTGPALGAVPLVKNNKIKELYIIADYLDELGFGPMNLNTWTTTQKFIDQNRGAAEALVQAWHEGTTWLYDNLMDIVTKEKWWEGIGAKNKEQAKWVAEYAIQLKYGLEHPQLYKDVELTDEYIQGDKKFLNSAADLGAVPSNWSDHVNYVKIPQE